MIYKLKDFLSIYASCEGVLFDINKYGHLIITEADVYQIKQRPFRRTKKFHFCFSGITSIDGECFSEINQLETLKLNLNNLGNLKADTFQQLKSLKCLKLSGCEISTIPNGLFTGLDQLEELDLSLNPIALLESNTFIGLKSLKKLDLSNLKSIMHFNENAIFEDGLFSPLQNLEKLYLHGNNGISNYLKSNTFSHMRFLTHLDISDCSITNIKVDFFSNLSKLKKLYLEGHNIERSDTAMFTGLKQLSILCLILLLSFFIKLLIVMVKV